jgi:NAD(P)-dependent dehydrogenase (short-subunit alcohol dehydrogenase family)
MNSMTTSPRTIVVTGASSGIGAVAATHFAQQGETVVVVGRDPERTRAVARRIGAEYHLADFTRFDDVRALAAVLTERHEKIDVLLNNAGGLISKRLRTVDGHEATIQSNLLSHYLLTRLLLPSVQRAAEENAPGHGRVITTSSVANRVGRLDVDDLDFEHHRWLGGWRAYGTAKLAVILFTRELARRTAASGAGAGTGSGAIGHSGDPAVEAYSVHPGAVNTSFGASSPLIRLGNALTGSRWGVSAEVGAAPLIALASASPVPAPSGTYFDRMRADGRTAPQAGDLALQRRLWERCAELTGLPVDLP